MMGFPALLALVQGCCTPKALLFGCQNSCLERAAAGGESEHGVKSWRFGNAPTQTWQASSGG